MRKSTLLLSVLTVVISVLILTGIDRWVRSTASSLDFPDSVAHANEGAPSRASKQVIDSQQPSQAPSASKWVLLRTVPTVSPAKALLPRVLPKSKEPLWIPQEGDDLKIQVKFTDAVRARATKEGRLSLQADSVPNELEKVVKGHGLHFAEALENIENRFAEVVRKAEEKTGREQADFGGILVASSSSSVGNREEAVTVAKALHELNVVEYVELEARDVLIPPPVDIAPPTSDYSNFQTYSSAINMDAAWDLGLKGYGVKVSDCEYSYLKDHEDLTDEFGEEIVTDGSYADFDPNQPYGTSHGTQVLGIMAAPDNGYGMTGMVHEADFHFYSERADYRPNRLRAVTDAIAQSGEGDVVILEMQARVHGDDYGPVELIATIWNLIKAGTDAGVVVVAAAGNGNQDLDSSVYSSYRARGDSGAIIVGAGSSTTRSKLGFSTYGERVDLQGWGSGVATLTAGNPSGNPVRATFDVNNGDLRQVYTRSFSGTSSATPIVASAVIAIQGLQKRLHGTPMSSQDLRELLVDTGEAQGTGGTIGPLPNLEGALDEFLGNIPYFYFAQDDLRLSLLGIGTNITSTDASLADYGFFGNGASVTFSKISGPSWLTVSSGGTLQGTPDNNDEGDNLFVVQMLSGSETKTMQLIVPVGEAPGSSPVISNEGTYFVSLGQPFQLEIMANQNPGSFGASNLPNGLSVNSQTGLISGTVSSAEPDTYLVILTATNSLGTTSKAVTLSIREEADFCVIAGVSITEDGDFEVSVNSMANVTFKVYTSEDLASWEDSGEIYTGTGDVMSVILEANIEDHERFFARIELESGGESGPLTGLVASASNDDGNVPSNTLDGDLSTRWSSEGDGEWLRLNFSESAMVESIRLAYFKGDERSADFEVEGLVDGDWVEWAPRQDSSGTALTLGTYTLDTGGESATAVRITGYGNSTNDWNSITEVEVIGTPDS